MLLTPIIVARILGSAAKAEGMAKAVLSAYPTIGHDLLVSGIDSTDKKEVQPFLAQLVKGGVITQEDMDKLTGASNDIFSLQSLKDELENDPVELGYLPLSEVDDKGNKTKLVGNDVKDAELLNQGRAKELWGENIIITAQQVADSHWKVG